MFCFSTLEAKMRPFVATVYPPVDLSSSCNAERFCTQLI
ncbi:hypothetical protein CDS [Bradyrhizobium sp.]|nr:hypothetical protein CDS [Bradyrhizobium sp.]